MATETDAGVFITPPNEEEDDVFQTFSIKVTERDQIVCTDGLYTHYGNNENLEFKERHHLQLDRFEYNRMGNDPGLVTIFNQEHCANKKPRSGTRRDVNEIVICMQRLGYNIQRDNIITDGTTKEILNKLKQLSEMDLSDKNCTITFFLTHGDEHSFLYTKDGTIYINLILKHFSKNSTLDGKPKIFIFQACKGESSSTTGIQERLRPSESSSTLIPSYTFREQNEIHQDMLVVYSTLQNQAAFRNKFQGSWFIQELCKVFSTYGRRDDILGLIMRINKCVAGDHYLLETNTFKKQMPVFISTLTKKFYLNRNKDRDLLLKINDKCEEMNEHIKKIAKDLEKLLKKK